MPTANLVEHFMRRAGAAMRRVFETLPDGLMHIGAGGYIEEPLVRFRILHHRFSFALDGEHDGPSGLLELFHELNWIAPKSREPGKVSTS
jgi:hypothetical protein